MCTVTDDNGETDIATQSIIVSTGGTTNLPPVAAFSYTCNGKSCSFDSGSSTDDFGIISYDWDFGDGSSDSSQITQHTFASQGNYIVTLTVTDDSSATNIASTSIRIKNRGNTSGTAGGDSGDSGSTTTEPEKGRKKCSDGIDNDGDGLIDSNDPECN